ncbi:MAG: hypothetical protein KME20_13530 [Kaiparowitsia implicata GSE-PSE-MK54-09C]|nr:hypothetical protein [Kaiparowitsia implicata GSE-PSE-MK54-09C]
MARLIGAIEVEREVTSDSEDLRQLVHANARSIFALGHILDVVYLVFNAPMVPNALSKRFR